MPYIHFKMEITLGINFVECESNIKLIVTPLESLGFVVHQYLFKLDQLNTLVL